MRYCKDIAHLPFWELGGILEHLHQNHNINLKQAFMLICMQKINCTTHYFLNMLLRNSKLVISGNMGMPGHTYLKMIVSVWRNLWQLSAGKISTSSFMFSLTYCNDIVYYKPIVFGTLGMPGYVHPKLYYNLVENCYVYLEAKNQLHLPCFYGDIAKICKLILGTLGMPGYTHPW